MKRIAGVLVGRGLKCHTCDDNQRKFKEVPACEREDYKDDCPFDLVLREIDDRNSEAYVMYAQVQDQVQYVGMDGVLGPLPLSEITTVLEVNDVPKEDWTEYIDRIRILHTTYCNTHNKKGGGGGDDPRKLMALPFAKRLTTDGK